MFFGDGYFNHHDHRVTGWATLDAVAPAAGNPHYFPEHLGDGLAVHQVRAVYLSGTLEPNCWIDIGDTLERKIDALFCHASQLVDAGEWFREFLRERAEDGRSRRRASATPSPSAGSPSAPDRAHRSDESPGRTGVRGARHSAIARSTSTATMPTPPAPIMEPTNVPMRCAASDSARRRRCRSR